MKLIFFVASVAVLAAMANGSSCNEMCSSSAQCPQVWVYFKGACYRYFGDRVVWNTALSKCRALYALEGRADLVSIHSDEENSFAYDLFRTSAGDTPNPDRRPPYYGAWIGFYQSNSESSTEPFVWTDGSNNTDYDNWQPGQPDNASNNEGCAHFWRLGENEDETKIWNDLLCSRELPYICKVKPNY